MVSSHMVKLMLHCVLVVYINPLAVELKDLWSDCRNTRMQMYIKKKKKKENQRMLFVFYSPIMEKLSEPA